MGLNMRQKAQNSKKKKTGFCPHEHNSRFSKSRYLRTWLSWKTSNAVLVDIMESRTFQHTLNRVHLERLVSVNINFMVEEENRIFKNLHS